MELFAVLNQPPFLEDYNSLDRDTVLSEGLEREGAGWAVPRLKEWGKRTGSREFFEWGDQANRFPPELKPFDRYGHRVDEVEYHPAWHHLMRTGVEGQVHSLPWNEPRPGAHVARVGTHYLFSQGEQGAGCPLTMTFASVPTLRTTPALAQEWVPRVTSTTYDFGLRPPQEKAGCLIGMAMTEKQGGSDVRANTTRAEKAASDGENAYRLHGHKWFCSAPMCDAFLTLAQTEAGLSCFLLPRILPDGTRNRFHLQRLKSKLGNKSNASSEVEYHGALAYRVGDEGRGVPTIIEMVNHTRLDCVVCSTALMRQSLVQALHHAHHRHAFGSRLVEQPLMQNVLADLALEWEAATLTMLRLARGYDAGEARSEESAFVRLATAVSKFWVCKRAPGMVGEALECLGGGGYVEESLMPRLYREAPLPSIWEGSGNVICLDVLRALAKNPDTLTVFMQELYEAKGVDRRYDDHVRSLESALSRREDLEQRARRVVEQMALALQGSLVLRFSPNFVADAFCAGRLGPDTRFEYGTLPRGLELRSIVERAWAT